MCDVVRFLVKLVGLFGFLALFWLLFSSFGVLLFSLWSAFAVKVVE